MFATSTTLDLGRLLTDFAVILVAAKLAAEIAERIGVPAVLGEILAGIMIGPSALGWAHPSDTLYVVAEIGVVLLLMQVGMEMDLVELRRVGRASILVAIIGVATPMLMGTFTSLALGKSTNTSLFVGAALTATSVGITARVFGDLRALSTTEARIVLGAAVTDDVLGLIILTVVTRIVEQGSVDFGVVLTTIGGALGFLIVGGLIALFVLPRVLNELGKRFQSPSSIPMLGVAATFGFAAAAISSNLAPIIGAFVAGLALSRTTGHQRISSDVTTLSSLFVPIFFVSIGIDTDIGAMADPKVIGLALLLTAIAIVSKVIAAAGALGTRTDKLLIGIGMIPRGEVGLIFATIGLSVGVFDDELHATILLVVLLTTVITPPMLRWRLGKAPTEGTILGEDQTASHEPDGGWLQVVDGNIELTATPPSSNTLMIALEASLLATQDRPGTTLLDWISAHRNQPVRWNTAATTKLLEVLRKGNTRSWRFLEVSAILERALPEVAYAMQRRYADASELDPTHSLAFPTVEALRDTTAVASSQSDMLLLSAFLLDVSSAGADAVAVLHRLDLDLTLVDEIKDLIEGAQLLKAAVSREPIRADEKTLREIAQHLRHPGIVEGARQLAATGGTQPWQDSALIDVTTGIQQILAHPELLESDSTSVVATRLREAMEHTTDNAVAERLRHAPTSYLLAHDIGTLIRQASLVEPAPAPGNVRVHIEEGPEKNTWIIDVASRNRRGLLARITSVLANEELSVLSADVATWPDDAVIDSFVVASTIRPSREHLAHYFGIALRKRFQSPRKIIGPVEIEFDNDSHPWHTVVRLNAPDQIGLLNTIAYAFAKAHIQIHHARIETENGLAVDQFEVSDRTGRKLSAATIKRARRWLNVSH